LLGDPEAAPTLRLAVARCSVVSTPLRCGSLTSNQPPLRRDRAEPDGTRAGPAGAIAACAHDAILPTDAKSRRAPSAQGLLEPMSQHERAAEGERRAEKTGSGT
jgi:hypothetical protein